MTDELKAEIRENGKLLMIQELSDWLREQPALIDKEEVIEFLLRKAEENYDDRE